MHWWVASAAACLEAWLLASAARVCCRWRAVKGKRCSGWVAGSGGLSAGSAVKTWGLQWCNCNLVLHFINVLIASPVGFKFVILCNFIPIRNSMLALTLRAFLFWSFISNLCDLTFNWPLNSQSFSIWPLIRAIGLEKFNWISENSNLLNLTQITLSNLISHQLSP